MHCLARETIASKECRSIGCSHELGNEFVFEVTLFRMNQFCLYFVNNNSSLHSKHFIKFHQFIDNNKLITSLSLTTSGEYLIRRFSQIFHTSRNMLPNLNINISASFL